MLTVGSPLYRRCMRFAQRNSSDAEDITSNLVSIGARSLGSGRRSSAILQIVSGYYSITYYQRLSYFGGGDSRFTVTAQAIPETIVVTRWGVRPIHGANTRELRNAVRQCLRHFGG